jgi:hypothetical protein
MTGAPVESPLRSLPLRCAPGCGIKGHPGGRRGGSARGTVVRNGAERMRRLGTPKLSIKINNFQ